jgi:predicted O-methyltransferase YrrM
MFRLYKFLQYVLKARGVHSAHSDFIYKLFREVFYDSKAFYAFPKIEESREALLKSNQTIQFLDLGAKGDGQVRQRKVADMARKSLKHPRYARLLFRLIHFMRYKQCLELGTSLGITTLYMSYACEGEVTTIEGSPEVSMLAQSNAKQHARKNIHFRMGSFDELLPQLNQTFDFIFIDGDHRGEAVLKNVQMLLPSLSENGCMVIDDINWSGDMNQCWKELCASNDFNLSMDLFELGLLFRAPGMAKQHFVARY